MTQTEHACIGCSFAEWHGEYGFCTYVVPVPVIPAAKFWMGGSFRQPWGGKINKADRILACPTREQEQ
jgi:hypothetical protein